MVTVPPLWKIWRELGRIAKKLRVLTSGVFYDPLRKPVYDLTSQFRVTATRGNHPLTDRVAVFVIFQPNGISPSILLTLEHMRKNRFSVLLVSNGPLQSEDRALLIRYAASILERPNVGYDFGAYRDGIRHLWSLQHDLSRLVLMNDSTWFPLRHNDDSLARMEALDADLAGHIFKTEDESAKHRDHVESHLLMMSQEFLTSTDFRRFWQRYRMSDYRETTIERGEKGFSQVALRSKWKVATLMGREWLVGLLQEMDDNELRAILDATIDGFRGRQKNAAEIRLSCARGEPWRKDFLDWVNTSLSNSRSFFISATFIMPALVYGGMGFLKKSADVRFHLARLKLLDLEAAGQITPVDDTIRAEILAATQSWKPMKGQETALQTLVTRQTTTT